MRRFPICAASLERPQSRLSSPVAPGPALTVRLRWMVQVLRLASGPCRRLEQAATFCERPLEGAYPYLWRKRALLTDPWVS
jgi:hypothetical protein